MRILIGLFAAVTFAAACLPSIAHDHATGIVKERMEAMASMAKHNKAISRRIKEKRDLPSIKVDADAIASLASHVAHLFPAGSTQRPTQARATIWQDWPDFERKAHALEAASQALANANPNDFAALSASAAAMTQTCLGCHEKYRVRK